MARVYLFASIVYYFAFFVAYYYWVLWIDPTVFTTSGGRFGFCAGFVVLGGIFMFASEIHDSRQCLRKDLLDILFKGGK